MEWEYKQVKISIDSDGIFYFKIGSILYTERTLDGAKMVIDEKLKSYYLFSQKDMDRLMSKLDKREQELVRSLYQEIWKIQCKLPPKTKRFCPLVLK